MLRLERAISANTDVIRLILPQLRKLDANAIKMQTRDFLVKMFRQDIDLVAVLVALGPKLDLRQHLIGEGSRHHERRVAGGIAEVQEAAFGQKDDPVAKASRSCPPGP